MSELSYNSIGHQQLTVSTAVVTLTVPTGTTPRHALIYVGSNPIRWRADGTDPTASIGQYVAAGERIDWTEPLGDYFGLITRIELIRAGAADATLDITYFT